MKYIIVLFLTINLAHAKCKTKTIVNVNKCVVDDKIAEFVDYETCSWPEDTKPKDMTFENLICDPVVPLSFFEGKLQEWKDNNIARITEELRVKSIRVRLKAIGVKFGKHKSISGLRKYMAKCNYDHANPAIWINEAFKVGNESIVTCLESKKAEVEQDEQDELTKRDARDIAKQALKDFDCETITEPYSKLICESRK